MRASNNAERIRKVRRRIRRNPKETPEKRGELRKSLVFFRKHQEKEKASKKSGEHWKKKELWYNTKKMWSSLREAGEIGENTGKRWKNTRETWRALFYGRSMVLGGVVRPMPNHYTA